MGKSIRFNECALELITRRFNNRTRPCILGKKICFDNGCVRNLEVQNGRDPARVGNDGMKWIDKLGKKLGKSASEGAIEQVKQQADDILPVVLSIVGLIAGIAIFSSKPKTTHEFSTISITNNYFYGRNNK